MLYQQQRGTNQHNIVMVDIIKNNYLNGSAFKNET